LHLLLGGRVSKGGAGVHRENVGHMFTYAVFDIKPTYHSSFIHSYSFNKNVGKTQHNTMKEEFNISSDQHEIAVLLVSVFVKLPN